MSNPLCLLNMFLEPNRQDR